MNSGGIEVYVTVDAEPARSKLRWVLTHRPNDLRDEITKLDGFQVRVNEKVRRQGKQFDYLPVLMLYCSHLGGERDPRSERFNYRALVRAEPLVAVSDQLQRRDGPGRRRTVRM